MRKSISVFSLYDTIFYDLGDHRYVLDNVQQLLGIMQNRKITKLYVHISDARELSPILEFVDVIITSDDYVDGLIELGFGHKVRVFDADEKYFGLIHPESRFRFTTNPGIKRLVVRDADQLRAIIGRELDYLFSSASGEYSLDGINTKYFKSVIGYPDIRPLLMCNRLEKFDISTDRVHHIEQVDCYDLKSYRYTVRGIPTSIPVIDEMINNRRFKKTKVANH